MSDRLVVWTACSNCEGSGWYNEASCVECGASGRGERLVLTRPKLEAAAKTYASASGWALADKKQRAYFRTRADAILRAAGDLWVVERENT